MIKLKEGDIYRWSWKEASEPQRQHPYHCLSQIGVVKDGHLVDTYWGNNLDERFSEEKCNKDINLMFIANFSDLIPASFTDRAYYLDADCVDLNHRNSTRGNFYLRKGAKKSLDKMRRIIKRDTARIKDEILYNLTSIESNNKSLKELSIDSRIYFGDELSLYDSHYMDERDENQSIRDALMEVEL